MASYIGTPTSRIDGVAKVTGAAKYAAEFNAPGLAYGSVVASTIAKGRIARIDTSAAHARRRRGRRADAREPSAHGGQRRSLQGRRGARTARRSGRCTTTRSCSTASRSRWSSPRRRRAARFAASLVQVEYGRSRMSRTCTASASSHAGQDSERSDARRCSRRRSRAAMPTRRWPRPRCVTRPNIMSRSSTTIRWSSMPRRRSSRAAASLTVYDKTQGVQNVQRYLCGVFGMKPEDVRVMSPFMGGGFGSGLRPQYQVVLAVLAARALQALGARRADAAADVRARLSARHDPAHRARRQRPTERSTRSRTMRSP